MADRNVNWLTLRATDRVDEQTQMKIVEVVDGDGYVVGQVPSTGVTYSLEVRGYSKMRVEVHVKSAEIDGLILR